MMFSKRSPFKQVPQGVVKNNQVVPASQKIEAIEEQRNKSTEKDLPKLKNSFSFTPNMQTVNKIVGMDSLTQRFFFSTYGPWNPADLEPVPDNTLLWQYSLSKAFPGEKKLVIAFKQQQYVISNFSGDGYPHIIWIICDGLGGYFDENAVLQPRLAALVLTEVNPVLDSTQQKLTDLLYTLKSPVAWDIPASITTLSFRLQSDNEQDFIPLPLPNAIALNFQIRHL